MEKEVVEALSGNVLWCVIAICITTIILHFIRVCADITKARLLLYVDVSKVRDRNIQPFEQQMLLIEKLLAVIDKTKSTTEKESKVYDAIVNDVWVEIKRISNSQRNSNV